jgi:hypothetical protein
VSAVGFLASKKQEKEERRYLSPNGGAHAVVVPVGKEAGRSASESGIEFQPNDGKISCLSTTLRTIASTVLEL